MGDLVLQQPHLGRDTKALLGRVVDAGADGLSLDDVEPYLFVRLLRCGYIRRRNAGSPLFVATQTGKERRRFESIAARRRQEDAERRETIRHQVQVLRDRLEIDRPPPPRFHPALPPIPGIAPPSIADAALLPIPGAAAPRLGAGPARATDLLPRSPPGDVAKRVGGDVPSQGGRRLPALNEDELSAILPVKLEAREEEEEGEEASEAPGPEKTVEPPEVRDEMRRFRSVLRAAVATAIAAIVILGADPAWRWLQSGPGTPSETPRAQQPAGHPSEAAGAAGSSVPSADRPGRRRAPIDEGTTTAPQAHADAATAVPGIQPTPQPLGGSPHTPQPRTAPPSPYLAERAVASAPGRPAGDAASAANMEAVTPPAPASRIAAVISAGDAARAAATPSSGASPPSAANAATPAMAAATETGSPHGAVPPGFGPEVVLASRTHPAATPEPPPASAVAAQADGVKPSLAASAPGGDTSKSATVASVLSASPGSPPAAVLPVAPAPPAAPGAMEPRSQQANSPSESATPAKQYEATAPQPATISPPPAVAPPTGGIFGNEAEPAEKRTGGTPQERPVAGPSDHAIVERLNTLSLKAALEGKTYRPVTHLLPAGKESASVPRRRVAAADRRGARDDASAVPHQ